MGVTLLIGNGLNQTVDFPCWKKLLATDNKELHFADSEEIFKRVSYPILFEMIMKQVYHKNIYENETNDKNNRYTIHKKKIAEQIQAHEEDMSKKSSTGKKDIITLYMKTLKNIISSVITTNFDHMLERAYCRVVRKPNSKSQVSFKKPDEEDDAEIKYSLYRYRKYGDVFFFHPHGSVDNEDTIMLGYEQYAGALQRIRATKKSLDAIKEDVDDGIIVKKKGKYSLKKGYTVPQVLFKGPKQIKDKKKRKREEQKVYWFHLLFTEDVHIVGFGLDYSELDVWWVITYRSYIKNLYPGLITNKIYFYHVAGPKENPLHRLGFSKEMMKHMDIEYIETTEEYYDEKCKEENGGKHPEDYNWTFGYKEVLDHIVEHSKE